MRLRRLSTLTAAAVLTPALVVLPAPVPGQAAQTPVETSQETAPLVDPADPAVGDGDVATADDVALAKDKSPAVAAVQDLVVLGATARQEVDPELAVVGVTWKGRTPLAVQYRTEGPNGWGDWQGVDTDTEGDGRESAARARSGSDPIVLTGVTAVQARILGADGDEPSDPELSVIDPGEGRGDAGQETQPGAAHAAASRPTIRSRASWGADESLRRSAPAYGVVRGAIVHHTAGTNDYSPAQVPAVLRGIYAFHVKDRGWSDIGYNFLVDKWGRVWEGRAGGVDRAVVGAQASGFNEVTMGISVMGDYRNVQPSSASMDAVTRVIAWKATVHGFDPRGHFAWKGATYRNVSGHKDVGQTTCPGLIYDRLGSIARRAAVMKSNVGGTRPAPQKPGVNVTAPPPGRIGAGDALARSRSGALFAVSPTGTTIGYARRIGSGTWSGYSTVVASGDLTGDGRADILARRKDGTLVLHAATSTGMGAGRVLGRGWGGVNPLLAVGDWNGDGRNDLMGVRRGRTLTLYPGNGRGGFGPAVTVGSRGWGFRHLVAAGDLSGDGRPDLVAVTAAGGALLYRGDGRGRFLPGVQRVGTLPRYATLSGLQTSGSILAVRLDGRADVLRLSGGRLVAAPAAPHFRGLTVFPG